MTMRGLSTHHQVKVVAILTPIVVELLHDLADDLANRLYCFDVILGLCIVFLQIL